MNYHTDKDEQGDGGTSSSTPTTTTTTTTTTTNPVIEGLKKLPSSNITNILPRMERLNGPYGMYATVYGISTKVVHVAHPIPAKAILMGNTGLSPSAISKNGRKRSSIAASLGAIKSPAYNHFKNMFGDGVFTADGKIWKAKRASVLHCLLKGCTKDDSEESLRLEREANIAADSFLSNAMILDQDGGNCEVNIVPLLQRATIGLIYRFITHHDVDSACESSLSRDKTMNTSAISSECVEPQGGSHSFDDSESSDSNSSLPLASTSSATSILMNDASSKQHRDDASSIKDVNPFRSLSSYLEAITNIRMIILAQSRSLWFLLPRWFYRTFSSMFQEEENQMVAIREFAQAACENAQLGSPLQMLRSRESHNPRMEDDVKNGHAINKELLDEAITLLFAGQDTSAATLSWTLHLLSLNPSVQRRLAKEVREHLEGTGHSQTKRITKKMISKMTLLDAVIKESMRLYPVAPFVVRRLPDDLTIPSDSSNGETITIPKDTFACIWIYSLHRNRKLWHRPNDFVPDRWIDPEIQKLDDAQTKHKGTFMPFAAGPRNCVGQPLAHNILRIMLARIMHECEVIDKRMTQHDEFTSEDDMFEKSMRLRKDMQAGFTVLPSGGVRLVVNSTTKKIK